MPLSEMQELYRRMNAVEVDGAVMKTEMKQLTTATKDNTSALNDVTEALRSISEALSYNKGAFAALMVIFSGIGAAVTLVIEWFKK